MGMRVFVAGVASRIGRLVAARLIADPAIEHVAGLDERACYPPVDGMRFIRADIMRAEWTPVLDECDAVIVLPALAGTPHWCDRHSEIALVSAVQRVCDAAAAAHVPKLIVANSAALYGAQPPARILESAPVRGHSASAYARARARVADYLDMLANDYPGTITRLRAGWLCGLHHVALLRQFTGEPVLACGYEQRAISIIHEGDVANAILFALHHKLPGVYNLAADDALTFSDIAALVGKQHGCTPLPWLVVRAYVRWRWLRWRTPPLWVRGLYRSAPLDTGRLHTSGWQPQITARAAFDEALDVLRAQ